MRLLVIHQNFPGQFKHLNQAWALPAQGIAGPPWGHPFLDVRRIGRDTASGWPGFAKLIRCKPASTGRDDQHPCLRTMENTVPHGQAVVRVLLKLKQPGWRPDTILAHPCWGNALRQRRVPRCPAGALLRVVLRQRRC